MSTLAEQNVIGALLIDPGCMDRIYNRLDAGMFSSELLGRVYLEFQRGYDNHYPVDMVILEQKLRGQNFPPELLMAELKDCLANTVTSANASAYAGAVADASKARRLDKFLNSVKVSPDGIDAQIGAMVNELESMLESRQANQKTLAEITRENKDKYFCKSSIPRINLGFPTLDRLLGGLEGGDVTVIGARPAIGKSAFVTQVASQLAAQGKRVGFYNLEMREKQVYERFAAAASGISLARLRRAESFDRDEQEKFYRANDMLERIDNIVITTGSRSVSEIRAESRHMGYDVIVIDYLQLLKPDGAYRGNRYAEVGAASRAIKDLAMEFNIPVIALSQLNRLSEAKSTKEPTMAELREAGNIEQDASIVILLWNLDENDKSKKGCKVEKQRQGKTGRIVLDFNGSLMLFKEESQPEWRKMEEHEINPFRQETIWDM